MIFNNIKLAGINNFSIVYLCEYIPMSRSKDFIDSRSDELILSFKDQKRNNHSWAVEVVAKYLKENLGNDIALVAVPPSKEHRNGNTPSHELIRKIVEDIGKDRNIIDASDCLIRIHDIESQHLTSGKRDIDTLRESTRIQHSEIIRNKDILVIDDITTSGNSFTVADELLKQYGARNVLNFAVGKTVQPSNLNTAFILDLDGTLFDTDKNDIEKERNQGHWTKAISLSAGLKPLTGVNEFFERVFNLGYDYRIVTSSPRSYAIELTKKLNIPNAKVIAYHDTNRHKPDIDPYMEAKRQMQVYEPCIIVVGNEESDIVPAKKLGMTTVLISTQKDSAADFIFNNFSDFTKDLESVIMKAENKFSFLLFKNKKG